MFPTKPWNVARSRVRKKFKGFPMGTSSSSSPLMCTRNGRTVRCAEPFGRTSVIALPAVLFSWFEFRSYFADFPCLREAEAASCEGLITECKVRDASKQVGLNKSPGLDGLPYEIYLSMSHVFVPILTDVFKRWFTLGAIPDSITKGVIILLKKGGRHVWKDLDGYRAITLLNTELKILTQVLANRLHLVISDLIGPK